MSGLENLLSQFAFCSALIAPFSFGVFGSLPGLRSVRVVIVQMPSQTWDDWYILNAGSEGKDLVLQ